MSLFDRRFGKEFFDSIPSSAGVYKFLNQEGDVIYVGKAKNLRKRLSQYRNAKRIKAHRKMIRILRNSYHIELEICANEQEAELRETQLIQEVRPDWNVVGAFYFLYPMIGIQKDRESFHFCYTTTPDEWRKFQLYGAFRSREITGDAFHSLIELFHFIGHPAPRRRKKIPKFSSHFEFRQISETWVTLLDQFLKGESRAFLEELIFALLENAGARGRPKQIQLALDQLNRFWEHEAQLLQRVRTSVHEKAFPIEQRQRDFLFLQYRHMKKKIEGTHSLDHAKSPNSHSQNASR